jgi:hypothetical protein
MPNRTSYRLAQTPEDFAAVEMLREGYGIPKGKLAFPTIVARRENSGEYVGTISRSGETDDMVLIEPMVAETPFIYIRLIEALESVLHSGGVTSYYFRVTPAKENERYLKILTRLPDVNKNLGKGEEGDIWFRKDIV